MTIHLKKCLFPALIIANLFLGWQGFSAGKAAYDSTISENEIPAPSSGLTGNNGSSPLTAHQDVSLLEESQLQLIGQTPPTPGFKFQWTLENIEALSSARNVNHNSTVLVAVLDTGIDKHHDELTGTVIGEGNFTDSASIDDIYGHGTSIAGIISAKGDFGPDVKGVMPGCRLLNVKVADDNGRCRSSALAEGIIWAVDRGARVINISIELKDPDSLLQSAVDYAWDKDAIIIAAAGNDGSFSPVFPAGYEKCLAVTAIQADGSLAPLANYGDWVDVAAPGFKIFTILPGNNYGYSYGTSFATAYVSGLASILFSLMTDANGDGKLNDEVTRAIETGYCQVDLPENSVMLK